LRSMAASPAQGRAASSMNRNRPDSDRDGTPDEWERAHGLNPRDPKDAAAST
jgi:hypothetical protein